MFLELTNCSYDFIELPIEFLILITYDLAATAKIFLLLTLLFT